MFELMQIYSSLVQYNTSDINLHGSSVLSAGDHLSSSSREAVLNHRSTTPSVDDTDVSIATITNHQDTSNMNSEQLCDLG